jgi:hypothetical protein
MSNRATALTPDALCAAARAETGLEDFAGEGFREGLGILCDALDREAELSPMGRHVARAQVLRLLQNRLRIEEWMRRHPEIETQDVPAPVFMIGLPRTGTTALAALLACDPERRSLLSWEAASPIPPPERATRASDPRIAAAQAGIDALHAIRPEIRAMYDASATGSTECQDLLGMEFRTQHFCGQYWVPSYATWQRDCDMAPAYRIHRRVLQLLQWRSPPPRWHLHSPVHMLSLDALLAAYPDARFLMTHRDPAKVLGSVCSLVSAMLSLASERSDPYSVGRAQLDAWVEALARATRFRDRVGEGRFADVFFGDLVADPVAAVERAYVELDLPFTGGARAGMAEWAAAHPRGRHGEHRYGLEDYGLDAEGVRSRFDFYIRRFGVPIESGERERAPR